MVSLSEKSTTCPICRRGVLAAYRSSRHRGSERLDGAQRRPQYAHPEMAIAGRQTLQVCGACGGSVLRAW